MLVCPCWVSEYHTRVCRWVSKCGFVVGQFRQSSYGHGGFRRMRVLLGMIAGCQFASWELADDKVSRRLSALRIIFEVLHLANAVIASCSFFCAFYLMYCLLMLKISSAKFVIFTVYRATERKTSVSRTNIVGDRTVPCLNSAESILSPFIWTLAVRLDRKSLQAGSFLQAWPLSYGGTDLVGWKPSWFWEFDPPSSIAKGGLSDRCKAMRTSLSRRLD